MSACLRVLNYCDGYRPDTIGGRDWLGPLPFLHYRNPQVKHSLESISPDGNGVHKKHALNLPAKIGINKSVMASGFKERVPRGVHPDE